MPWAEHFIRLGIFDKFLKPCFKQCDLLPVKAGLDIINADFLVQFWKFTKVCVCFFIRH